MVNQFDTRGRIEQQTDGAAARASLLFGLLGLAGLALAGCSSSPPPATPPQGIYKLGQPYQIAGRWYYPEFDPAYDRVGVASWYGAEFDGRPTANGEVFDREALSAAHPTMPLPSIVRVTNLANSRQLELRVNDRGPFVGDRIIDLSQSAARELGFEREGTALVRVEFLRLAEARGEPPTPGEPAAPPAEEPAPLIQVAATSEAICRARFIQLGAFAEPARAVRLSGRLRPVAPAPVRVERSKEDGYTRVWLGPIADGDEADRLLGQLQEAGYRSAFFGRPATSAAAC